MHSRYADAMKRGRAATRETKYPDAEVAYETALDAKPGDAQALAERGYARLLNGESERASEDLARAAELTQDRRLLAQIWFNRGLVEEKIGSSDATLAAFYLSNRYAPSAAAGRKLGNQRVCPVRVGRGGIAQAGPTLEAKSLDGLLAKMANDGESRTWDVERPNGLPAIVIAHLHDSSWVQVASVLGEFGGVLRAVPIGSAWGGRCPGEIAFEVERSERQLVWVRGTELGESGYAHMCVPADASPDDYPPAKPCLEFPPGAETRAVQSYCAGGTPTLRSALVYLRTGRVILNLEQPAALRASSAGEPSQDAGGLVQVTPDPAGYRLHGFDCDAVVSIALGDAGAADAGKP